MLLPTYTVSSPFVVPPRPALTRRGFFFLGVTLLPHDTEDAASPRMMAV